MGARLDQGNQHLPVCLVRGHARGTSAFEVCNYFFGFNGTGKSTIARLIADPTHRDFAHSTVKWSDDHPLDVLVYNREFIKQNYDDADDLKGVFTLGKDTKEVKAAIAVQRDEAETLVKGIASLRDELTQAEADLAKLDDDAAEACWNAVKPRESVFRGVFAGGFLRQPRRVHAQASAAPRQQHRTA